MPRGTISDASRASVMKRAGYYSKLFRSLFAYSVAVDNIRGDAPESWLIKAMIDKGRFGWHEKTGAYWYLEDGADVNRYGEPTKYNLSCDGTLTMVGVDASEIVVFEANPECYAIGDYIEQQALKIARIEAAMNANVTLSQSPFWARVKDKKQADDVRVIFDEMAIGAPLIVTADGGDKKSPLDVLDAEQMNRPYYADRLHELASEVIDETLCRLGIFTANTDKRERVQSAEVGAEASVATDYLYMMIDHFNKCSEVAGAPETMRANTQGDELVETINNIDEQEQTENEKIGN